MRTKRAGFVATLVAGSFLVSSGLASAAAPPRPKTHLFPLEGAAPAAIKKKVSANLVAALKAEGRHAVVGKTALDDSLLAIGCEVSAAECRTTLVGILGTVEIGWGSLESKGKGFDLVLHLARPDTGLNATASAVLPSEDAKAELATLVRTLVGGGTIAKPADPATLPATSPGPTEPFEPPAPEPAGSGGRIGVGAIVLLAAGAAVAGGGVALGLATGPVRREFEDGIAALPPQPTESDLPALVELRRLRARGSTQLLIAEIAVAAGGAMILTGAVLAVLGLAGVLGRETDVAAAPATPRFALAPLPGGVAAAMEVRW